MLFKSLFWHLWTTYTHYTYTKFWNSRSFFLLKMRKNPEMQLEKFKIHAKTQLDWFFIISFKKRFRVQSLKRYWIPRRRKKSAKKWSSAVTILMLARIWLCIKTILKKSGQQGSIYSIYKVYGWKKTFFNFSQWDFFHPAASPMCSQPNK